jgi:hypothetical protein
MKLTIRWWLRGLAALALLGIVFVGISSASSSLVSAATNANAGGNWHYKLTFGGHSYAWDATLQQSGRGILTGRSDPASMDCLASVKGRVAGRVVAMKWQVPTRCGAEKIKLSGTAWSSTRITGSVVDSQLGKGTFTASKDL